MASGRSATKTVGTVLTLSWLLAPAPVAGSSIAVTNTADHGPGSLRDAIASAASGDTVNITVSGTITLTTGPLLIRKNLTIAGPGPSAIAISGNRSSRVLSVADIGPATVAISGLSILDGSADVGGGILNGGSLTLTNVVVSGNSANYYGGGLYSDAGSTLRLGYSVISGNSASVGGGIDNHDGTLEIDSTTISGNTANGPNGFSGGGIHNGGLAGTVTVTNSTIANNTTAGEGGAIYIGSGTLTVLNTTIAGNSSSCDSGGCASGGGIFNHSSTVSITNSTLVGNVTVQPFQGGNIISVYGIATIKNSILAGSRRNCLTYSSNEIVSDGNNLSDDLSCTQYLTAAGDRNGVPAGLSPEGLRDNGGPTDTIGLLATSPAVDMVSLDACVDAGGHFIADQRGVSRPQAGGCDSGAFELILAPTTLSLDVPSPVSFIAGSAGPLTLSTTLMQQVTGSPIAGAAVTFDVDGTSVGTATTDSTGGATFSFNPSFITSGNHAVAAVFTRQTISGTAFEASSSPMEIIQVVPYPYVAQIRAPIRADGTSVFSVNRGVVPVKFALSYNGAATCDLPPATIALFQTAGSAVGPINESVYVQTADNGSNFRVDTGTCEYVFNLGTSSLGPGTYQISISLDQITAGRAEFGLR